ncbi:MAG: UvrD-helicase domain-containing protein [Tidjanibacter sp.]|nr:UvrD-helicase domain-containing protein [Tidjanibacter sp.]
MANTEEQIKILKGLNPAQEQAVVNYRRPSLIVAGAGSGKTRVLTCRIAYMISEGVEPWSIMALTFTNKAAREMRARIESLVGERSRYIWMGTFHSIFAKILYAEAEHLGFQPNFTIYDQTQSEQLVKSIIKEFQLSDEQYKPREVHSRISLAKNNLLTAGAYEANTALCAEDRERRQPEFARIYKTYCARCKANNAMDFDDLLLQTNILLRDFPEVLEKYRRKFAYVLVDEYQDTNSAQYLIVKRLTEKNSNLCVVGDDAQSIYSFRGARIENILQFQRDFPNSNLYKLEQNYRSTQTIVDAANSIIGHNERQIRKKVFSENAVGEKIKVLKAYTDGEEAQMVADGIRETYRNNGNHWDEIAVLYRTNAQSRAIEEALRRRDVPYRIFGGHSFYDRKEVKDLLAYFKTICNPRDDESLQRIINYPARGIGDVTVARIKEAAAQRGISMWELLTSTEPDSSEGKIIGRRAFEFRELICSLSLARQNKTLYEFGVEVASRSTIIPSFRNNPSPESEAALQNIEELLNSMQNFRVELIEVGGEEEVHEPTVEEWLQNISLLTDLDTKDDGTRAWVTLMTVHSSKGLEFGSVFLVGVEENLFPSIMSVSSPEKLEEERRLFYVALTRAKQSATISFAETRFKWGQMEFAKPSRFIGEIDRRYLDVRFADEEDEPKRDTAADKIAELKRRFDYRNSTSERNDFKSTSARQQPPIVATPRPAVVDRSKMHSVGQRRVVRDDQPQPSAATGNYAVGQRVSHQRFGEGTIIEIEQLVTDLKITVLFNDPSAGRKSLLAKYAKLTIL